jgi:hypothetical protein
MRPSDYLIFHVIPIRLGMSIQAFSTIIQTAEGPYLLQKRRS